MNILDEAGSLAKGLCYDCAVSVPPKALQYMRETGFAIMGFGLNCPTPYRWDPERTLPEYGIIHMVGGSGEFVTPGEPPVRLYPGMVVCHSPSFRHDVHALSDDEPFIEDYIGVSGPLMELWYRQGLFRNGIFNLGKARRVASIAELLTKPDIVSQTEAIIQTQALFLELQRHPHTVDEGQGVIFKDLGENIMVNLGLDWSITRMADFCGMTPNTFRIKFRDFTGHNPKTYIDRLRMRRAQELLACPENTLDRIAEILGYSCSFHLSRRFKEITGISPSAFRANQP